MDFSHQRSGSNPFNGQKSTQLSPSITQVLSTSRGLGDATEGDVVPDFRDLAAWHLGVGWGGI